MITSIYNIYERYWIDTTNNVLCESAQLTFSNGETRDVDFVPQMQKGICCKLQDMEYFRSFTLDPFTVDWHNEIGFAPEFLFEQGTSIV